MKSMTGFGSAAARYKDFEILIEITSVNHKNLDINIFSPKDWLYLELPIINLVRKTISRGKINVYIKVIDFSNTGNFSWDQPTVSAFLEQLRIYSETNRIPFVPTTDLLFHIIKTINKPGEFPNKEVIQPLIEGILGNALGRLDQMKQIEGNALAKDLESRIADLSENVRFIREKSLNTPGRYKEILFQRLEQAGLEIDLSDERLLKEIALFADRCDISEELTRLGSHFKQFLDNLQAEGPIGRKMDFLWQELNREFNTIGSKANQIEITHKVIECKNELERIREQVQNIE